MAGEDGDFSGWGKVDLGSLAVVSILASKTWKRGFLGRNMDHGKRWQRGEGMGLGDYLYSQAKALPSRILAISFKSLVIFPSIGFIGTPTLIVHSVANFSIPNFSSAGTRSSYEGCRAKACLTTSSARLKTAVLVSFVIVGIELSTVHSAPGGAVRLNALDRQINIVVLTAPIRN